MDKWAGSGSGSIKKKRLLVLIETFHHPLNAAKSNASVRLGSAKYILRMDKWAGSGSSSFKKKKKRLSLD